MQGSCLFGYTFINNCLCNYKLYYLSNTLLWNQQGDHKKHYFICRKKDQKKNKSEGFHAKCKVFVYLLLFYTVQLPAILAGSQIKRQRTGTNWKKNQNPHYSEKSFNHPCQKPRDLQGFPKYQQGKGPLDFVGSLILEGRCCF